MALGIEMDTAEAPIRAVQTQRPGLWDLTPTHHGLPLAPNTLYLAPNAGHLAPNTTISP